MRFWLDTKWIHQTFSTGSINPPKVEGWISGASLGSLISGRWKRILFLTEAVCGLADPRFHSSYRWFHLSHPVDFVLRILHLASKTKSPGAFNLSFFPLYWLLKLKRVVSSPHLSGAKDGFRWKLRRGFLHDDAKAKRNWNFLKVGRWRKRNCELNLKHNGPS